MATGSMKFAVTVSLIRPATGCTKYVATGFSTPVETGWGQNGNERIVYMAKHKKLLIAAIVLAFLTIILIGSGSYGVGSIFLLATIILFVLTGTSYSNYKEYEIVHRMRYKHFQNISNAASGKTCNTCANRFSDCTYDDHPKPSHVVTCGRYRN
jgi:hypothetical protein